jgi:hypothetical protein
MVKFGDMKRKATVNRHLWQKRYFVLTTNALFWSDTRDVIEYCMAKRRIEFTDIMAVVIGTSGKGSEDQTRLNIYLKEKKEEAPAPTPAGDDAAAPTLQATVKRESPRQQAEKYNICFVCSLLRTPSSLPHTQTRAQPGREVPQGYATHER